MRLLVLNGNTTQSVTGRMVAALRARCPESVQLIGVTAAFGMPYVASRSAVVIAAHAVLDTVEAAVGAAAAAGEPPFDACFYACFGEPGIEALRERHLFPVVGMAEASIACALQLGGRFSIVTTAAAWPAMLAEQMRRLGLDARCAGISVVQGEALALAAGREEGERAVRVCIEETLAAQAPDVVIVAGASLAGYGARLDGAFPVPVLCSLEAGFEQTLALARLRAGRASGVSAA